jgi:SAM-dependent methyltransferase
VGSKVRLAQDEDSLSMTTGSNSRRRLLPGLKVGEGFTRHPFDAEFGVRTSGLVAGRELKSGHAHDRYATAYYGVAPSVFHALLRRWQRSRPAVPIDQFTFIDIGAGMGRAVLLASQLPFREVVGVELNPTLVRIARRNLAAWRTAGRARGPMRMICGDAVDFTLLTGYRLVFMFNPFGAPVMRRLLKAWCGSPNEPLDLVYVNNEQERTLELELGRQPGADRLFLGQIRRSKADAIADHRILANQPEGEYASSNFEDCSIWRWRGKSRE